MVADVGARVLRHLKLRDKAALKPPDRFLMWVLAEAAHDDDLYVWLGLASLARETGMSESTVRRSLRNLIAHGFVEVIQQGNGAKRLTIHRVTMGMQEGERGLWSPHRKQQLREIGVAVQ